MSAQTYRVAWPYANVRIIDPATGSQTVAGLTKDTPVPATADSDDVKRLVAKGALVAVERPEPKAEPKAEPKPEPKAEAKAEPKAESKAEPKLEAEAKKAPAKLKSDS